MKQFLKPNGFKIAFTLLVSLVVGVGMYYISYYKHGSNILNYSIGLPFNFSDHDNFIINKRGQPVPKMMPLPFMADLIVLYFIACFIELLSLKINLKIKTVLFMILFVIAAAPTFFLLLRIIEVVFKIKIF